ncbi:UNVERIFIED_CONTAM: hypothetical protein GTU68_038789 [Idotea baltica]|nr:hypothetical protein [Idotea baltica]
MSITTKTKLAGLRELLAHHNLDAYFIPNTDPHQSEYIAPYWKTLAWISGFTGSAGNIIVSPEFAGLWTDSRYFIQGERQLENSGIELMKLKIPHTPEYIEWMIENLPQGGRVGVDGKLISLAMVNRLKKAFVEKGLQIIDIGDLFEKLWKDRPAIPASPIFVHELAFSGKSRTDKLNEIREIMTEKGADAHLLTTLDDIAWAFNIRGGDVSYNPVAICYALITQNDATLFINPTKVPSEVKEELVSDGIVLEGYESIGEALSHISSDKTLYYNPSKISLWLKGYLPEGIKIETGMNLSTPLKSIKNETEVNHIRNVMVKDGVAMVRFLIWLEENVGKTELTEVTVAEQLEAFRAELPDFKGPSFGTIAGYQGNGAIVHYSAEPATAATLHPEGIFLLDSGGQYLDGTTDITRTVALGSPTAEQRRDFTLVLKGHIALATAIFPEGTRGYQLEGFARRAIWAQGMNYGHGTGHGVGFFLNVHEGPQSIGSGASGSLASALQPGMLTSNEPGLYHEGKYGIRIENLVLCVPNSESETFGKFLAFETVTLCPIDTSLLDGSLMTEDEVTWLNDYHQVVLEKLSPYLSSTEKEWLNRKTETI